MAEEANSGWSLFTIQIPPSRIDKAIEHPDALQIAYDVGVLELLSLGIALLGFALVFATLGAYLSLRRAAKIEARKIAKNDVPRAVEKAIRNDGFAAIKEVLKDPQTLATIQAEMERFGLNNAPEADDIETGQA